MEEDNMMIAEEEKRLDDIVSSEQKRKERKSPLKADGSDLTVIAEEVDGAHVPPQPDERTFNVNQITGDIDRDERGRPNLKEEGGMTVDNEGRRVNERGYLVDENGNIIEKKTKKVMFNMDSLDENGEIPSPLREERYNFNVHEVTGKFERDKNGSPLLKSDGKGGFTDDLGRKVNEKGRLVDEDGHIVNKFGRKVFDKIQLQDGDIPSLLNYEGTKYKIDDISGTFERDERGDILPKADGKNKFKDAKGKAVNKRGYLIDKKGNIIDKEGKKIWNKEHLTKDGEPPKIFPFTKFNTDRIRGNFDTNGRGQPILKRG